MKQLNKNDLASFSPIPFYNLFIYKPKIEDIDKIGYEKFNYLNGLLVINQEDLEIMQEDNPILAFDSYDPYNYIISLAKNPIVFLELKIIFFTYLMKDIEIKNDNIVILGKEDFFLFDSQKFFEFQNIIRQINCLEIEEDSRINSSDKEMKNKFYEARKKLRLAKAKNKRKNRGEGLSLSTIQFALSAMYGGYTINNIQQLTIYQLLTQFKICQKREAYLLRHAELCAGEKGKLKYWIN